MRRRSLVLCSHQSTTSLPRDANFIHCERHKKNFAASVMDWQSTQDILVGRGICTVIDIFAAGAYRLNCGGQRYLRDEHGCSHGPFIGGCLQDWTHCEVSVIVNEATDKGISITLYNACMVKGLWFLAKPNSMSCKWWRGCSHAVCTFATTRWTYFIEETCLWASLIIAGVLLRVAITTQSIESMPNCKNENSHSPLLLAYPMRINRMFFCLAWCIYVTSEKYIQPRIYGILPSWKAEQVYCL